MNIHRTEDEEVQEEVQEEDINIHAEVIINKKK